MHREEFYIPAFELLKIIKSYKFDLRVFDFTIAEISGVLRDYPGEAEKYPDAIGINSLYQVLKEKGCTGPRIIEFLMDIEKKLKKHDITIEYTNLKLDKYYPSSESVKNIKKYKKKQPNAHRKHDLLAIDQILKNRSNRVIYKMDDAKAIFLTSDKRLFEYNYIEYNHQTSVSEVFLDRVLINILWLLNPKVGLPTNSLIQTLSQKIYVNENVWETFFENLNRIAKEGAISASKIAFILNSHLISTILRHYDEEMCEAIDTEFVIKLSDLVFKEDERIKDVYGSIAQTRSKRYKKYLKSSLFAIGVESLILALLIFRPDLPVYFISTVVILSWFGVVFTQMEPIFLNIEKRFYDKILLELQRDASSNL
jgi:hypothetical protein